VLDENGIIVDTNDAWQLFARLNDGAIDKTDLGISYLDVCDLSARWSIDADPPRPPMVVSRLRPTAPPPDAGTTG
jgi:hypothetical protein